MSLLLVLDIARILQRFYFCVAQVAYLRHQGFLIHLQQERLAQAA